MNKETVPINSHHVLGLVNVFQGTDSTFDHSTGNIYPVIGRPWGMTSWSLQTREDKWFFHRDDKKLQAIRATHQASPWLGDYGHLALMPFTGAFTAGAAARSSAYVCRGADPAGVSVELLRYGITVDLTATARCAIMQLHYKQPESAGLCVDLFDGPGELAISTGRQCIEGWTRAGDPSIPEGFRTYFVIELDAPIRLAGCGADKVPIADQLSCAGNAPSAFVQLQCPASGAVGVRVGTSFISIEQARLNLQREIGRQPLSHVRQEAEHEWESILGRVRTSDPHRTSTRTFYTALYRSVLFPRAIHEYDEAGDAVHCSPYDGRVHTGYLCTDNGFWDTHRTVYPLLSIVYPDRLGSLIEGWINAYRQGGWLPKWANPSYRNSMIGTHADVVLAEAIVKGIGGFDVHDAYAAIRKNATEPAPPSRIAGRVGLAAYHQRGYIADAEADHSVARTLDFCLCDHAVARAADYLGHAADAQLFAERSRNYRLLFDASTGFMRARSEDGTWIEPFDPASWTQAYCEGSAWQFTWAVPHDPQGLADLFGGPSMAVARLEQMLKMPANFDVGRYDYEIHEMTEMALAGFGQYAHCNQPVHHVLYLFAHWGAPHLTRHWVRRVMAELYSPDRLPGDEDNGEMSAWYVLSAMGIYPMCPADAEYTLGIPHFSSMTIHRPGCADLLIERRGDASSPQCTILFNEKSLDVTIAHADIAAGGRLVFSTRPDGDSSSEDTAQQLHVMTADR